MTPESARVYRPGCRPGVDPLSLRVITAGTSGRPPVALVPLPQDPARMLDDLLGTRCALCHTPVTRRAADRQLCDICLADLPWLVQPEIPPPAGIVRQISPLAYVGPPRDWVLDCKRDRGLVAARILGVLLAEVLEDAYPRGAERPSHVVPVPLSWQRLVRRGHNQAALIAAPVSRRLGCRLVRRGVRRRRHTRLQPGLDAEARRHNVLGAFESRRCWHGATVAIVDDVVTTGATATALAEGLLAAGAGSVHLWSPTIAALPQWSSGPPGGKVTHGSR